MIRPLQSVVVIDDSESDRYLAKRTLKKAAVAENIFEYEDPIVALEDFANQQTIVERFGQSPPPVLILLDINMPRLSGFEFLDALEERFADGTLNRGSVAIVMFTSSENERDRSRAFEYSRVMDYASKPLRPEDLKRTIALVQVAN